MTWSIFLWALGVAATVLGSAGIGGMLKTWLDHKRGTRKDSDEVAMGLVKTLEVRIAKLEADLDRERARCDAELGIHRHRINNQRTMIHSLLLLFEMPAAKRKEALLGIRRDLATLERNEAVEKATIAAAPLARGVAATDQAARDG